MDTAYSKLTLARSRVRHISDLRRAHSDQVIRRRVRTGAWKRMSRSIYLVASDDPTWYDRIVAAALATGLDDVVVCGPTAAELLEIEGADLAGPIHLCSAAPDARRGVGRGVVMHQLRTYDADVVVIAGLRLTSPLRTVRECARTFRRTGQWS